MEMSDGKKWSKAGRKSFALKAIAYRYEGNNSFRVEEPGPGCKRIIRLADKFRVDFFVGSWKYHAIDIEERGETTPAKIIEIFQRNPSTVTQSQQPKYKDVHGDEYVAECNRLEEELEKMTTLMGKLYEDLDDLLGEDNLWHQKDHVIEAKIILNIEPKIITNGEDDLPY